MLTKIEENRYMKKLKFSKKVKKIPKRHFLELCGKGDISFVEIHTEVCWKDVDNYAIKCHIWENSKLFPGKTKIY